MLGLRLWGAFIALPILGVVVAVELLGEGRLDSGWILGFFLYIPLAQMAHPYLLTWLLPWHDLMDEDVRTRAEELTQRADFSLRSIRIVDGHREGLDSSGTGAFVTGLGKSCRIFLFGDALLQGPLDEFEAILSHELAHVELGHLARRNLALVGLILAMLGLRNLLLFLQTPVLLYGFLPVMAFLGPGLLSLKAYERHTERAADLLAAKRTNPLSFARALERLFIEKDSKPRATGLTALLRKLYASHPPLEERIARLKNRNIGKVSGMGQQLQDLG